MLCLAAEKSSQNSVVLVSFILFACIIKELNNKFIKINVYLFTQSLFIYFFENEMFFFTV